MAAVDGAMGSGVVQVGTSSSAGSELGQDSGVVALDNGIGSSSSSSSSRDNKNSGSSDATPFPARALLQEQQQSDEATAGSSPGLKHKITQYPSLVVDWGATRTQVCAVCSPEHGNGKKRKKNNCNAGSITLPASIKEKKTY
jgi:hypothetical protein